jgi:putative oxidoreductase
MPGKRPVAAFIGWMRIVGLAPGKEEFRMWLNLYFIPILIRVCLVVLFPFSALDKIVFWKDAIGQADSSILPRWSGAPLLVFAIIVEGVAPFLIVFGWHDRIAALVLAFFCVVTAILYHPFWAYSDFWKSGNSVARSHFWDFLKNFGLVGGLLLIVFATQLAPAGVVARRPLSSTAVYTPAGTAPPAQVPGWNKEPSP